jgi:hypothetical protein
LTHFTFRVRDPDSKQAEIVPKKKERESKQAEMQRSWGCLSAQPATGPQPPPSGRGLAHSHEQVHRTAWCWQSPPPRRSILQGSRADQKRGMRRGMQPAGGMGVGLGGLGVPATRVGTPAAAAWLGATPPWLKPREAAPPPPRARE